MSTSSECASYSPRVTTGTRGFSLPQRSAITILSGGICAWLTAYFLDMRIYAWLQATDLPGDIERAINLCEVFAHGMGVLLILITVGCLQPERWRQLIWAGAAALSAGLLADGIKLLVPRLRPQAFDMLGHHGLESFKYFGMQSFADLFAQGGTLVQSFPSAHTATAFAFATALSWYFGRGQHVFLCLASGAALQRIYCGAHWPSDAVMGAALGLAVSPLVLMRADRFLRNRSTPSHLDRT